MKKDFKTNRSKMLFDEACNYLAGGVGSAARGVKAGYTPYPLFIEKGVGSKIYDVDKNEYIDYLCALGPLIHGHAHPKIIEAIKREIEKGTMYAAPYELEFNAAKKVGEAVPSIDLVRFGNSGTEAVQTAIRLARAYKGKDKIIKFEGHYHGWADNVIVSCHPPLSAMGLRRRPHKVPQTNGIPESAYEHLIIIPWNDKELLEKTIKDYKHEIAAVITEPYMGNSGAIIPEEGYLESMREITADCDILLIFDEVITGFRLAYGGAQEKLNITPDITTLAKALGGGAPVSAIGGRRDIMELIARDEVLHAGTYDSNRVNMAAVLASLELLEANDKAAYSHMYKLGDKLIQGLKDQIERHKIDAIVQGEGPMFQIFFTKLEKIRDYREAVQSDMTLFSTFRQKLLENGVLIHPGNLEAFFLTTVHNDEDIVKTLTVTDQVFKEMA